MRVLYRLYLIIKYKEEYRRARKVFNKSQPKYFGDTIARYVLKRNGHPRRRVWSADGMRR